MEFTFETWYTAKSLACLAEVVRKTNPKKGRRFARIVVRIIGTVLLACISDLLAILMILFFLFEDKVVGYIAWKRMLPGTERAVTVFTEDGYVSTTDVGKTEWNYDKILVIAETADFFVFLLDQRHGQLYDKRNLRGGTAEEFRGFIEKMTGKQVQRIA